MKLDDVPWDCFVCRNFTPKQAEKIMAAVWMTAHATREPVSSESQWPWDAAYHEAIQMGKGFGRFGGSPCSSRATSSVRLHWLGFCPVKCLKTPRTELAWPPSKNNWARPQNHWAALLPLLGVFIRHIGVGISRVPELDFPLARVTLLQAFSLSQEPGIHS